MALHSAFVEYDQVIRTFPADAANQPFAYGLSAKENVVLIALAGCSWLSPGSRTHGRKYGHDRAANSAGLFATGTLPEVGEPSTPPWDVL